MWFRSILKSLARSSRRRQKLALDGNQRARRLLLEPLDVRCVLAFNPLGELPSGGQAMAQIAGDFSGDGRQDLVVSNSLGVQLYRGNGDGTFQAAATISATAANSVVSGDLDADGNLDVVTNREILSGNGDGTFQAPIAIELPPQILSQYQYPVAQQSSSVVVGDLNADGKLDLVVSGRSFTSVFNGYGYSPGYGSYPIINDYTSGHVNVLLGNGDGTVGSATVNDYPPQDSDALGLADLNHDGKLDLVAMPYNAGAYRFLGNGDGSLAAGVSINTNGYTTGPFRSAALGDFDQDGHVDIVAHAFSAALTLTKGRGDGTFQNPNTIAPDPEFEFPLSVSVDDINADGRLDLVYTTERSEATDSVAGIAHVKAKVFLGDGNGIFSASIVSEVGSNAIDQLAGHTRSHSSLLGDFNGDTRLDLAVADVGPRVVNIATSDGNWQPPPSISIGDVSIVEGTGGTTNAVFTVTVSGDHNGASVSYSTANSTAVAGADYTSKSGTLTFGPGESIKSISVPIIGDAMDEYDEQFLVDLTSASGAVITVGRGVGTIVDNDEAPLITINDVSMAEGNQGLTRFQFTVGLSAPSGKSVSAMYQPADGTATSAGEDFRADVADVVSFTPGQTAATTIYVWVLGDRIQEANETFFVNLSGATNGTLSDSQGVGTIVNDDGGTASQPPSISIGDASIVEGNSGTNQLVFSVRLSQASNKEVRVNYATANDTAKTGDNDFESNSGTIRFAPGETTKTISITINGDKKVEQDETFKVKLSGAVNGEISDSQGLGSILNDDGSSTSTSTSTKRNSGKSQAAAFDAAFETLLNFPPKRRGW